MLDIILAPVKNFFRIRVTVIDNLVFALHYRWTVIFLLIFTVLVTCKQQFGEPIQCITHSNDDVFKHAVETFCWIHTTFSVPSSWNKPVGTHIPYPGIDNSKDNPEDRKYHTYYQWVGLTLFLQAVLFYLPHYIWKCQEQGLVKKLSENLHCYALDHVEERKCSGHLVQYLVASWNSHTFYFLAFVICEVMNFIIVICQIIFLDTFLGGEFSSYGTEVVQLTAGVNQSHRVDAMSRVFPRMTKCLFHQFGSGGSVETHDFYCMLPLNIVHEKIYIFVFFWFIFLATLSSANILYRLLTLISPLARYRVLQSHASLVERVDVQVVSNNAPLGDWFLLYLLSKNLTASSFKCLMEELTHFVTRGKIESGVQNKNFETSEL